MKLPHLKKCAAHQSRFYQRNLQVEKTVALHRKIFYDEVKEKLILITANVTYTQGKFRPENPMILPHPVESFRFLIVEPESGTQTTLDMAFEECIDEREMH